MLCGDNQYFCERCARKVDARRQVALRALPPLPVPLPAALLLQAGGERSFRLIVVYLCRLHALSSWCHTLKEPWRRCLHVERHGLTKFKL